MRIGNFLSCLRLLCTSKLDYTQLEEEINKIIEMVEKLPQAYQAISFEVLLNAAIRGSGMSSAPTAETTEIRSQTTANPEIPFDVKAFLVQYSLSENIIDKLFLRDGNSIKLVKKLSPQKTFTAQKQVALLAALENALKGPETKFEFSYEQVRVMCKNQNKYDSDHFTSYFKKLKTLFVSLSDEKHVELSPDGKDELADLVAELTK